MSLLVDGGTLDLTDVTADGNTADSEGGAYLFDGAVVVTMTGGAVTRNRSASGGGIFLRDASVTANEVDFGTGATDNSVDDLNVCGTDYGTAASFVAEMGGCE